MPDESATPEAAPGYITPEAQARWNIDRQLAECGWVVQNYKDIDITASSGVAVREYPLEWEESGEPKRGFADYLLYADGQAIGVVEAKPAGYTLQGVHTQSKKYTEGLDERVSAWKRPLPFAYESTGVVTQFTNGLNPDPRSREVFTFHRPEELLRRRTCLAVHGGQGARTRRDVDGREGLQPPGSGPPSL